MAYIGKGLDNGVRNQFIFAATQGQTAFSGADSDGKTLAISDILYTDCFQNGVKLEPTTDYTVTLTSLTLVNAASLNDVVDIVSFDIFAVPDTVPASTGGTFNGGIGATTGTFSGDVAMGVGSNITLDSSHGANSTAAFVQMDGRISYSNDYSDTPRGPNKVVLQSDGTWISGLGISSNSLDIYSGGDIKFNKSTSTTAFTKQVTILSGGGIAFNNDTAAANALDDYEEGTYTATIACASGSITLNSSFNELAYTKVGRVVHVQGFLKVSSVSSPTGATNLNLPFTSVQTTDHSGRADNLGYAFLNGSAVTNGYYILFCELLHNQANNRIFWDNNNSGNNIGDDATAADTDIRMNFSYIAA